MDAHPTTEQLWALLHVKLEGYFRSRVKDEHTARDLLQETFVRIHANLETLKEDESVGPWVFRIARNLLIDHYRTMAKRDDTSLPQELPEAAAESENGDNMNEIVAAWIPAVISDLREPYQTALRLYEMKGLPQAQVAEQLGISLSAAKSRIQRGRSQLKKILHDCCLFETDAYGNVLDYSKRVNQCSVCECSPTTTPSPTPSTSSSKRARR